MWSETKQVQKVDLNWIGFSVDTRTERYDIAKLLFTREHNGMISHHFCSHENRTVTMSYRSNFWFTFLYLSISADLLSYLFHNWNWNTFAYLFHYNRAGRKFGRMKTFYSTLYWQTTNFDCWKLYFPCLVFSWIYFWSGHDLFGQARNLYNDGTEPSSTREVYGYA